MQLGLPDALDLMVICAEAGLSLDASLMRVSRELEPTWPELSEEFGITAAELTFLPDRRQAFENLNAPHQPRLGIRGVVNTLLQTAKFGTPLAQSLRVLAAEFREARITRAEEKAARLPAMLTVPMILFILPTCSSCCSVRRRSASSIRSLAKPLADESRGRPAAARSLSAG